MTRHGTVLVFREDVTPAEAARALERIRDVLSLPDFSYDIVPTGEMVEVQGITKERHTTQERSFDMADMIQEFDDDMGGPVWYIP
tara:strand:+ start:675 stop:929 length:255 start_codon:yes stop_codon:yes gene_type:complete